MLASALQVGRRLSSFWPPPPALAGISGVGPHVAAQLLGAAGDNPHRSQTSFTPETRVKDAGTPPKPAALTSSRTPCAGNDREPPAVAGSPAPSGGP